MMLSQNGHSFTPPPQKAMSAKFLSCRRRRQKRHAGSLRGFSWFLCLRNGPACWKTKLL